MTISAREGQAVFFVGDRVEIVAVCGKYDGKVGTVYALHPASGYVTVEIDGKSIFCPVEKVRKI